MFYGRERSTMQIVYSLKKVTHRRLTILLAILSEGLLFLLVTTFFASISSNVYEKKLDIVDVITIVLSLSVIVEVASLAYLIFEQVRGVTTYNDLALDKSVRKNRLIRYVVSIMAIAISLYLLFYVLPKDTTFFKIDSERFFKFWIEGLPFLIGYVLLAIFVVAYKSFRDWHLGQYVDYRIELYDKELLNGLSHFHLSNEVKRAPHISEMKKNIADIFVIQKEMK